MRRMRSHEGSKVVELKSMSIPTLGAARLVEGHGDTVTRLIFW